MKKIHGLLLAVLVLSAFQFPATKKVRVFLVGDSTIAIKDINKYPETGWGMPFSHFFDSCVIIDNRAKNGRSTKSFREEGLWTPIVKQLQEGDYVFIQFGHNDEGKQKIGRYTTPAEFKANLEAYVQETRSKNALPVLITPVSRRSFDSNGNIKESHLEYTDAVKETAAKLHVPCIDLDEKSKQLLQELGPENSKLLFNHLAAGEHPNYPEGLKDDTHFNELGARKMAQVVLASIKELNLELAKYIVKPAAKK